MNDKDIEDIINEEDDFLVSLGSAQVENVCGDAEDVKPPPQIFFDLPKLAGGEFPPEFTSMVDRVYAYYRMLPEIDHEKFIKELIELSVKKTPTPTLQLINQELQKVQAVKERVSEIMRTILPAHTMKKRYVEILKDSWMMFSKEKSVDKRKADAIFRLSEFESDYLAVDVLMKTAVHVAKNLESTQEILSRRITIVGLELKMNDLGRHSVPDYDFESSSLEDSLEGSSLEGSSLENNSMSIGVPVDPSPKNSGDILEAEEYSF